MGLFNNIELAREIENIKIKGTKAYIANRKDTFPLYDGDFFALNGEGCVFCTGDYIFCAGFGLTEEVSLSDVELIEKFAHDRNASPYMHFEVTPYSNPQFLTMLQDKNYTLDHFLAVWVLDLEAWVPTDIRVKNDEVSVLRVEPDQAHEWATAVAAGIAGDGMATEEAVESIRCFLNVPDTAAFLVKENGQSAAGGFIMLDGQLGELFLTSTLHSHRGKGYQNLLIEARIQYAKSRGCRFLTVTTKPNNTSARNMERNGFQLAYNKVIMKSPLLRARKTNDAFNGVKFT